MHYVIVDVETTGGSPKNSKITEIALFKYDGNQIIDEFISLINPEQLIPEFIVRLTGITDKMVESSPKFYEIAKQILDFCEGCVFVAHNVSFDYGMLRNEFKNLGFDFRFPHLCTVRASRYVIPGHASYSLGKLTTELGIALNGRHRAGADALATTKLFDLIYHKDPNQLKNFIQLEINPKRIHQNLQIETIDSLPTKIGVYRFYDEFNQLIYIGKSISIKKRVEQHLRNFSSVKGTRMIEEIARVDYDLTGSELLAMLLESELIKTHLPKYNRQLRKNIHAYGLYDILNDNGYLALQIGLSSKNNAHPLTYFSSKKEGNEFILNKTEEFQLCQKINGVYPASDSCFQHGLGLCNGACIEKEANKDYNLRVEKLIQSLTFSDSTFYILDKGRNKFEKSLVWIQKGRYIGHGYAPYNFSGKSPENWDEFIESKEENRDIKSILSLYLRKDKGHKIITL